MQSRKDYGIQVYGPPTTTWYAGLCDELAQSDLNLTTDPEMACRYDKFSDARAACKEVAKLHPSHAFRVAPIPEAQIGSRPDFYKGVSYQVVETMINEVLDSMVFENEISQEQVSQFELSPLATTALASRIAEYLNLNATFKASQKNPCKPSNLACLGQTSINHDSATNRIA